MIRVATVSLLSLLKWVLIFFPRTASMRSYWRLRTAFQASACDSRYQMVTQANILVQVVSMEMISMCG